MDETPLQKYRRLMQKLDECAYGIVGASRVLARTLDADIAQDVLKLIAKYDETQAELQRYSETPEWRDFAKVE